MTILSVLQAVSKVIALDVPDSVFSSTSREHIELAELANEAAGRIVQSYDWQLLKTVATVTGDGSTEAFSLPTDYMRMLKKAQVWSSSLETPLSPISDADQWLGMDVQSFDFVINAWIIYGGNLNIKPALATGVTGKYFYMSNLIVAPDAGSNKAAFDQDADTFRLDENLLKLAIIWQWRANKGLPYQEDLDTYEMRKEDLISADKGSRMLRVGKIRMPSDTRQAYPQSVGL